jgi:hypothetical protein
MAMTEPQSDTKTEAAVVRTLGQSKRVGPQASAVSRKNPDFLQDFCVQNGYRQVGCLFSEHLRGRRTPHRRPRLSF